MAIPANQALGQYTQRIAELYKEKMQPTNFLRSFFPSRTFPSKLVSVWVQRGYEQLAVDCYRGSEGHRNQWAKTSEKIFEPLYFRENFDLTSLQLYDVLFSPAASENAAKLASFINTVADMQMEQTAKIERAIELMCSQILETGVIQMSSNGTGLSVDYLRRSASIKDTSASAPWTTGGTDVFSQIKEDCDFIRQYGKASTMVFDVILGELAIAALYANDTFLERQNLFNMKLDSISVPQKASETSGAVFHGMISAGPYKVNLWTYPQTYDASVDTTAETFTPTKYVNDKKIIVLPPKPKFFTAFGAVPQVIQPGAMPIMGDFVYSDWISQEKRAHIYEVESCPLPVPVAIDQIVTRQVVA